MLMISIYRDLQSVMLLRLECDDDNDDEDDSNSDNNNQKEEKK